jgi:enoyl-CoA hydratase/carnithine racemase
MARSAGSHGDTEAIAMGTARAPAIDPPDAALEGVRYSVENGVARVTLDRPAALNAYTTGSLRSLARVLALAAEDDRVGVIVLTGSGTQAFSTGGDVKEYATRYTERPHDYWKYMAHFRAAVEGLLRSGKPTIARLNGIAVGGGNELHLACDLSVAASHIYLGQVGVGVGSVACGGATQWLPLAVGDRRARRMLFLNERVPAARALEWGLVSELAPSVTRGGEYVEAPTEAEVELARRGREGYSVDLGRLDAAVDALARRLLGMFPECLRYTKAQTNFWKELAWDQTVGHGQEWLALHFATAEPYEGMTAFSEKRAPRVAEMRRALARGESPELRYGPPVRRCPGCGSAGLPAGFDYCGRCGTRLVDAAEAPP